MSNQQAKAVPKGGRPPAGTDARKRLQILEGAGRVFSTLGFDAASMSDVAREAQVSKATLYVYFQDKEHLFTAICAEKRDRNIAELIAMLNAEQPVAVVLGRFGKELVKRISQPYVIAANRIVIGVAERMPEVGKEFFEAGSAHLSRSVAQFLDQRAARGELNASDTFLAAIQFLELVQAGIFRPRLYGVISGQAPDAQVDATVDSAVRVFLSAYGRP